MAYAGEGAATYDRAVATLHGADVVLPMDGEPIRDGAVLVEGDRVADLGPRASLVRRHQGARFRSWPGVLTPGLVNAHAHLQYSDYAELATSGLPFPEWITVMVRRRAATSDAEWVQGTRRGLHLLLRSGTTSVADVVSDPAALAPTARSGLGGVSYIETVGADADVWLERARARLLDVLATAPTGRDTGVSPHALYTLGSDAVRGCLAIGRERGLRAHPHLAESRAEHEFVASGTGPFAESMRSMGLALELMDGGAGCSPARHMDDLGALGPDVHVAHGVHCDPGDRALLRERGTAVALCPRSNATLQAGEPPVAAYLAEGNPIALGTDSLASSPSLDLLADARVARDLARRQGYDEPDLNRRIVEAATVGGASAMGLGDAGVLRPGARADLAVFDVPVESPGADGRDPYAALVDHGEGSCVATVLGGRIVHRR